MLLKELENRASADARVVQIFERSDCIVSMGEKETARGSVNGSRHGDVTRMVERGSEQCAGGTKTDRLRVARVYGRAVACNSVRALNSVGVIVNKLTRALDDLLHEGFGHGTSEPRQYGASQTAQRIDYLGSAKRSAGSQSPARRRCPHREDGRRAGAAERPGSLPLQCARRWQEASRGQQSCAAFRFLRTPVA